MSDALKKVQGPGARAAAGMRPISAWKHGDLRRQRDERPGLARGPACCVLLDFAEVAPGHWVEDACTWSMHWAHAEHMNGVKPVALLAARKTVGLDNGEDYSGNIRRLLAAAATGLRADGNPLPRRGARDGQRLTPVVVK